VAKQREFPEDFSCYGENWRREWDSSNPSRERPHEIEIFPQALPNQGLQPVQALASFGVCLRMLVWFASAMTPEMTPALGLLVREG
jgi:hypothetical protein